MSVKLGQTSIGAIYLGATKIGQVYLGSTKVYESTPVDPYNPLGLPDYTIRLKFTEGVTPTFSKGTAVQVSSSPNVWDLTRDSSNWSQLLQNQTDLIEVVGANTTLVTNMSFLFNGCASLTDVRLFDTSNVTDMNTMFKGCSNLTTIPHFDTSNVKNTNSMFMGSKITTVPLLNTSLVTNMGNMFNGCTNLTSIPLFDTSSVTTLFSTFVNCSNVESGALALYQQASTQASVPSHSNTFLNCGSNTVTGAAELAQIPSSWGGTGA